MKKINEHPFFDESNSRPIPFKIGDVVKVLSGFYSGWNGVVDKIKDSEIIVSVRGRRMPFDIKSLKLAENKEKGKKNMKKSELKQIIKEEYLRVVTNEKPFLSEKEFIKKWENKPGAKLNESSNASDELVNTLKTTGLKFKYVQGGTIAIKTKEGRVVIVKVHGYDIDSKFPL